MPTNRAGDRTATQAPSAAPQPEGTITQALPADGDPPNASTLNQAWKVCADFIDWLFKPQAKSGAWAGPIVRFRSALGHARHFIDHLGFPMGRIIRWEEPWLMDGEASGLSGTFGPLDFPWPTACAPFTAGALIQLNSMATALQNAGNPLVATDLSHVQLYLAQASSALGAALTDGIGTAQPQLHAGWRVAGIQSSGAAVCGVFPPDTSAARRHRYLVIEAGDTAGDYTQMYRSIFSRWDDDLSHVMEWEGSFSAANIPNRHVYMGWSHQAQTPGIDAQDYAVFDLGPSGNISCVTASAGTPNAIDSGVAATTAWMRFRIEFVGGNVADDTTRAVRFYINGALVATSTVHVPANLTSYGPSAHFSVVNTLGGASGLGIPIRIGPIRGLQNLYGADVL